jgi:glycerol-3-phosphate dehydrogenase (NAD(P)+)
MIVFVVPSVALREIAGRLQPTLPNEQRILLSCTKGIEHGSGLRMSEVLEETLPNRAVAVMSGPNLAHEVASNLPTATVLGCGDSGLAASLQSQLGTSRFRVYTGNETVGIELGGALKNVFALAAGVADGLGLGDNAKAALITRSLAELIRMGTAMGGKTATFYGLSGAGDLMLTCYSERSRNHSVGRRLGEGEGLKQITSSMKMVAEGIPTTRSAYECARKLNVDTPVIDQVYAMVYEGKKPIDSLQELLRRDQKPE